MATKRSILAVAATGLLTVAAAIPMPALGRHSEPPCRSGVTLVTNDGPPTPRVQTPRWGCEGPGVYVEDHATRPPGGGAASEARAIDTLRIERLTARRAGAGIRVSGLVAPAREGVPVRIRVRGSGATATRTVLTNASGAFATTAPVRSSGRPVRITASVPDGDGYRGSSRATTVQG